MYYFDTNGVIALVLVALQANVNRVINNQLLINIDGFLVILALDNTRILLQVVVDSVFHFETIEVDQLSTIYHSKIIKKLMVELDFN